MAGLGQKSLRCPPLKQGRLWEEPTEEIGPTSDSVGILAACGGGGGTEWGGRPPPPPAAEFQREVAGSSPSPTPRPDACTSTPESFRSRPTLRECGTNILCSR